VQVRSGEVVRAQRVVDRGPTRQSLTDDHGTRGARGRLDQLYVEVERAPGHSLVQAGEDGLAQHRMAEAGIPYFVEEREASLTIAPSAPALPQEVEVLCEQSVNHGFTSDRPARLEIGLRGAIALQRFGQFAAPQVNETLKPADAAEKMNVASRLREGLQLPQFRHRC